MNPLSNPPARYLVVLTCVRTLGPGHRRDREAHPEPVLEAFGAVDLSAAKQMFGALCSLPMVRSGRQRAKIIELAGDDETRWDAPIMTSAPPAEDDLALGCARCAAEPGSAQASGTREHRVPRRR